jgi:hypothetical protein
LKANPNDTLVIPFKSRDAEINMTKIKYPTMGKMRITNEKMKVIMPTRINAARYTFE